MIAMAGVVALALTVLVCFLTSMLEVEGIVWGLCLCSSLILGLRLGIHTKQQSWCRFVCRRGSIGSSMGGCCEGGRGAGGGYLSSGEETVDVSEAFGSGDFCLEM